MMPAGTGRAALRARRILRLDFTVADLAPTRRFYEALGFEGLGRAALDEAEVALLGLAGSRAERLGMRLGRQEVGFVRFNPPGRAYPAGSTSADLWFQHIAIAVSDMAEAHRRAMAAGAEAITRDGPQRLPANTGGVTAFKFRDPDGHPLELLFFPAGTGAALWHAPGVGSPFLGIDHTAIAVGHTAEVRAFYEGLGLAAGERSHNRGPEQERLDDIAADRVEVVPMMLPQPPPHVELLGYEVGRRRPMPPDTRADDIWATRIWIEVESLDGAAVDRTTVFRDGTRALRVRDPDGHAVVLVERPLAVP